jgi:hypothetical protein
LSKPGQRLDEDVRVQIETLARDGYLPSEIRRRLEADERFSGREPSDKTIQKYRTATLRRLAAASTAPWRPTDSPPEEVRFILEVLAHVIERTKRREITVDEAEWISRLHAVEPDMPPGYVYELVSAARDERGTARVTQFVAFRPWDDNGRRLRSAARRGRMSPAPFWPDDWLEEVAAARKESDAARNYWRETPDGMRFLERMANRKDVGK